MTALLSVAERFAADTAQHHLSVLKADGVYRHIRFAQPGTNMYAVEIVTWPGSLAVTGDMGSYLFTRTEDMLLFFSGKGTIAYRYWAEKESGGRAGNENFDAALFAESGREALDDQRQTHRGYCRHADEATDQDVRQEFETALGDSHETRDLMIQTAMTFSAATCPIHSVDFPEAYEWSMDTWDYCFTWICHALRTVSNQVFNYVPPATKQRTKA
mgnify:FL=1